MHKHQPVAALLITKQQQLAEIAVFDMSLKGCKHWIVTSRNTRAAHLGTAAQPADEPEGFSGLSR